MRALCWTRNCIFFFCCCCLEMFWRAAPVFGLKKDSLAMSKKPNYKISFALLTIIFQFIKTHKMSSKSSSTHITIWFNSIPYQSPNQWLFFPLIALMTKPIEYPSKYFSSCLAHPINCSMFRGIDTDPKVAPDWHINILTIMMLLSKAY